MMMKARRLRQETLMGYLYILPNFLGFLVLTLIPVAATFFLSFTKWDAINDIKFVGFDNFVRMFNSERFYNSLSNTLLYTIVNVPVLIILSILAALLANQSLKGIGVFKTILFFPNVTSFVAVGAVFGALFSKDLGPINEFLRLLGFTDPPGWFASSQWALTSVIIVSLWKGFGYFMIIYMAGLSSISNDLYEYASLEGASRVRQFFSITLPMLTPTTIFVSSIAIIGSLQVFDQIYVLTKGGPGTATQVIVYQIVQEAYSSNNFGYSAALSLILFVLVFVVTIVQYRVQDKFVKNTF
jgi:multiple sugar transport system permease protein